MDREKSVKLTGLIKKLTVAANKSVKRKENFEEAGKKQYAKTKIERPITLNHRDFNLRTAKLLK